MYRKRRQIGGARIKGDFTCGLDSKKKPFPMQTCLDMKQVRYWGKEKIDPKLLEQKTKASAAKKVTRMDLISQRISLLSQIKKLSDEKNYFFNRRTLDEIKEINKKGAALVKKLKEINSAIEKAESEDRFKLPKRSDIEKAKKILADQDQRYRILTKRSVR